MLFVKRCCLLCIICCLFASCEQVAGWLDGTVSDTFSIERFDRLQNELGLTGNFSTVRRMNNEYPLQTQILIEEVLELGSVTDSDIMNKLEGCLSDTAMLILMADGERKFGDMKQLNAQFDKALKRMNKELPRLSTPKVYAQFSGLNESVVVSDTLLGFSIDKYMGTDYPMYKKYFYENQIATMSSERIVSDCIFFYLRDNYPLPETSAGTLMDNMLNLGKLNWITMKLTGNSQIELLLGFSDADSKWLKQNRQKVIDYCMSRQHSTDPLVLRGLLNATGIPAMDDENAPALLGVWLGYQMVNQYMKNQKSMTTEQLALKDDMADLLAAFNYKTE